MKILSLDEVSCRQNDLVFGASVQASAWVFVIVAGVFGTALWAMCFGSLGAFRVPRPMAGWIALVMLLFVWVTGHALRSALRPSNWLLRVQGDNVLIKFRSYENWRMNPDDPQVFQLHRDELRFVRKNVIRQATTSNTGDGVQAFTRVFLEIGLKNADTSAFEHALAEERERPGFGSARNRTKWLDNPVQLVDNGILQIAWRGGAARVRPKIDVALDALRHFAPVEEAQKSSADLTVHGLAKLPPAEQLKQLRHLHAQDAVQAIATARQLYGCSIAEAKKMVEDAGTGDLAL